MNKPLTHIVLTGAAVLLTLGAAAGPTETVRVIATEPLGAIGLVLLVGSRFVPYRKRTPKPKAKKGAAASGTPAGASAARTRPDYSAPASSVTPTDTTTV